MFYDASEWWLDLFKIVDIFWNDLIVDCKVIHTNVFLYPYHPYAIVFLNCHMHKIHQIFNKSLIRGSHFNG